MVSTPGAAPTKPTTKPKTPPRSRAAAAKAESNRLAEANNGTAPWRDWGPYLSERGWGTVRVDYSADGDAWSFFPHDHARSRVYRWNEDGMAGFCDESQTWCLSLGLWNGVDPILKERMFGLAGPQGNHGEDVKEYWWYLDGTPTHSWNTWRYHYPQREFPYGDLVAENARRGKLEPEYELADTGAFADGRYWVVTVDYAKGAPRDLLMQITVENAGPDEATLHVLPPSGSATPGPGNMTTTPNPPCGSTASASSAVIPVPGLWFSWVMGIRSRCSARTRRTT